MINQPSHSGSLSRNYYLELNEEGQPDITADKVFSVEMNSIITMHLFNGSSIAHKVMLISNVYQKFPSPSHLDDLIGKEIDLSKEKAYLRYPSVINTSIYFIIQTQKPGVNCFAFVYYNEANQHYQMTHPLTIIAQPQLVFEEDKLDLRSIQLQTVLSKNLGKLSQFDAYYRECHLLKYNLIHFSSFQELSASDSLFTIRDQLTISDGFFEEKLSNEAKLRSLAKSIHLLHTKYHIGGVVDIVLNQTSKDSEWVKEHPECGYNLANCPWLCVAYELDKLLIGYSNRFFNKKVGSKSAPFINNEADLEECVAEITKEVHRSSLEEFFLIPIERYYDEFKAFYLKYKEDAQSYAMKKSYLLNELKDNRDISFDSQGKGESGKHILSGESLYELIYNSCFHYGESRFGVTIEVEFVGILLVESITNKWNQLSEFDFLQEVKGYINRINEDWMAKASSMLSLSIQNVKEFLRYDCLQLKRTGIKKKLLENYFAVLDPEDKSRIFACNGWLSESDESDEGDCGFTELNKWNHLKRKIMIWPDTIKLNYGRSVKDCSFLIEHMSEYVRQMASVFDGFMIDSLLSLPVFALQVLMDRAREVNPNLILIGELLDGTKEKEVEYTNKVGINLFMKELIWCSSLEDISEKVVSYGEGKDKVSIQPHPSCYSLTSTEINFDLTKVSMSEYRYLLPQEPGVILFDLTSNNETYYERFNNISLNLSMMSCLAMCDCAIGSTRGFDQLFPFQPSITQENRLYSFDDSFEGLLREIRYQSSQSAKRKEVFFEFHPRNSINPSTKTVKLALSPNWTPDIALTKINDNLFTAKVELPKGKYQYKYVLDGNVWTIDQLKPMESDQWNNANNVLDLCDETKLIVPDLKMLRHDLNAIRDDCKGRDTDVFVHNDNDLISIIRLFKPSNRGDEIDYDGYGLISRPGFDSNKRSISSKIFIPGEICDFISGCYMITSQFEMNLIRSEPQLNGFKGNAYYTKDLNFLSSISTISIIQGQTVIDFHSILPNTVVLFKIKLNEAVRASVLQLNKSLSFMTGKDANFIEELNICDLNHALFKCEKEEMDASTNKRGIYRIDKANTFVYAGLAHLYQTLISNNTLNISDNAVSNNLKEGDWLIEYTLSRLKELQSLKSLSKYVDDNIIKAYIKLYPHLKPHFFTKIIEAMYYSIVKYALSKVPSEIVNYGGFSQTIHLARYEFIGNVLSSSFNPLEGKKLLLITQPLEPRLTVSAGLPHYSIEHYRCFGRETFMSFKGLLLLNRLFSEAKTIIKMYAATLRHGMIPDQLGRGLNPRYNGRDCPWLFIQAVKDYISFTNDYNILKEELEMVFLSDKMDQHLKMKSKGESRVMLFSDVIQEIFQSHAQGIDYREWNGSEFDHNLSHEGFNIRIHLEPKTGFIYGGSQHNAGTWMNKIGSSERSKNKGRPATPRNGAAIEIIALLYSSLDFVIRMFELGYYKHKSVSLKNGANYPFTQWKLLIIDNFDEMFYLPRRTIHNKEGIYKDYISDDGNSSDECKLRPNYLIAMVVAPELFKRHNAIRAIENAERYLLPAEGLGLRSLDYEDKDYCGALSLFETGNYSTSNGFNKHNGPEFVWLVGYYLLAKQLFCSLESKSEFLHYSSRVMIPLMKWIKRSPWMGLPDYSQEKGKECESACGTYSLSIALIYEVLHKMISFSE